MMMFESMIESIILMYGAKIRGWKEQEEVEKVQEKDLRGMLGVDRETAGYTVKKKYKSERGKESCKV
jgi:hypothetical protein